MRFFLFFLFLSLTAIPGVFGADDNQAWVSTNTKLFQRESFKLSFYFESRFREDAHVAFGYFFGPKASYGVNKRLSVGGAYKQIHFKNSAGTHFARIQRLELEATYNIPLSKKWTFLHRNRYENLFRENRADTKRMRSRITLRLNRGASGPWKRFYFGSEFFYNLDTQEFDQTRLVPLGFNFKLNKRSSLSVFYLIQQFQSNPQDNHALGLAFSF